MRRSKGAPSTDYVCYAFMTAICDFHESEACGDWRSYTYHACEDDMYSGAAPVLPAERCDSVIDAIPEETTFARMQRMKPAEIRKIKGHEYVRISNYPMPKEVAYEHMQGVKAGGFPATVVQHRGGYWVYRKSIPLD